MSNSNDPVETPKPETEAQPKRLREYFVLDAKSKKKCLIAYLVPSIFFLIYLGPHYVQQSGYGTLAFWCTVPGLCSALAYMPSSGKKSTGLTFTSMVVAVVLFVLLILFLMLLKYCSFPMKKAC